MTENSIASNIDLVESESHIVIEDGNWDHEITNEDDQTEIINEDDQSEIITEDDQPEIHVETVGSPHKDVKDEMGDMTEVENEFHLEAYSKDDEILDESQANSQIDFFDESDEESDDDCENVSLKNPDALVNVLGKKMTTEDMEYAADMKQQMKDFFKKCPPDLSFSTLVQLFIQRIPQQKHTFVLSHDEQPNNILPFNKYAILCSAVDCSNAYYRDGSNWEAIEQKKNFFGFPPNQEMCKQWIQSLGRLKYLNKTLNDMQMFRVCEDHFTPEDFTNEYREELLESAVPSLLLGRTEDTSFNSLDM